MRKIWKGLMQSKVKLLSVLFAAVAVVCLTTTLVLNLTIQPAGNDPSSKPIGNTEAYYDNLADNNAIEMKYLMFETHTAADAPNNSKVAGVWCKGIDVNQIISDYGANPGLTNYIQSHPALIIPATTDGYDTVVGIDFSNVGWNNPNKNSGDTFLQIVSLIEVVKIPKSVQYITAYSFNSFTKLGYFETPFIGTSRGSSARGINMTAYDIKEFENDHGQIPTSDPFGSMFGEHNPLYPMSGSRTGQGDTASWFNFAGIDYEPRFIEWKELDENSIKSECFGYYIPNMIDYLYITDEKALGNYSLAKTSARHVEVTAQGSVFSFGAYTFADSGKLGDQFSDPQQGLETIKLNMSGSISMKTGTFNTCETLQSIIIPRASTNIEIPDAFLYNNLSLKTVYMPGTVTSIGKASFMGCEQLERIAVYTGNSSELTGDYETDVANNLVVNSSYKFDMPTGLKSIGADAFRDCKSFDTIYVPNAVETIGFAAYSGCSSVERAILPFVGAHVGRCTSSCVNEEGKKVHHGLSGWIFGDVSGNANCYDARQNFIDETGALATKPFTIPKKLKEITLTKETHLTTGCFQGLASLQSITINDAVGSNIVEGCFDQCGSLQRMTVPAIIGGNLGAFFKGSEKFDGSAVTVGSYRVPTTLKIVRITNMQRAEGQLFHNCSNIETVEFSNVTNYFGHAIFYNNQSLKNLTVPIVGMQRGEFDPYYYMWWRDIRYRNSLMWLFSESLQTDAYQNTSQYYKPYSTVYYTPYIPNSLKSVTVTNESEIDYHAFRGFTGLENISITNVPDHIDEGSFWNCGKLQSLQLPYIGANLNRSGDAGWSHVLGFIFGRNASYGNSYAVSQYSTYYIPNGLETVEIGTTGTEVAYLSTKVFDYAFSGCSSIRSIDFKHADIQTLGTYAFANCSKLEDVNYPNARYSHVGNYAFYNCKTLKRMKKAGDAPDEKGFIPDTVKTIGNHAFDGTSVGYLDSGAYANNRLDLTSYTSVGDYAFANCLQIDEVVVPENLIIGSGLFAGCSYLTSATLPTNNKMVTPYMFQNCVSLPGVDITGITNIPAGIFSGCTNLSFANGLLLNPSINSIGAYAFAKCSSLEHFELPAGLYSIDEGAFQGCKNLEYLTIPRETKVINPYGWNNCDDNFYFYVYEPEEKWPSTWVYNWNCYYPVYVLGDVGEDVFTYTYVITEKRYYITGITRKGYEMGLSGTLRIPSRHDGVDVVGIDETLLSDTDRAEGAQKIATQTGITRVILPKGVTKIVGSPFQTGQRVDIYTEYTKAEILKIYNDSKAAIEKEFLDWEKEQVHPIPEATIENKRIDLYSKLIGWKPFEENEDGIAMSDGSGDTWDTRNWTSGGMLYYKDYWQYGTEAGTSSLVPYLKIDTFKYVFDEYEVENTSYTGSPIKVRVVRIQLPGEIFINEGLDITIDEIMYIYESDVKILNYAYSNNVNVGTANVAVSINRDELEYYNENQWGPRAKHPLYLIGTTTLHYQILPIEILLLATANDGLYYEKEYDGSVFSYYQWQSGQISGLEGYPGASFSGTLSSNSANAGEYYPYDLVWTKPWRVMLNNIDVTKNFRVTVQFFVVINPMEVEVVWTRAKAPVDGQYLLASLSDATRPDGSPIYLYPYIGGEIKPTAVAKKYGTDAEYVPGCDLLVNHISNAGIYPYEKEGFQNTYHMYAYVAPYDANNYVIRATDRDTGEKYIPQVTLDATTRIVAMEGWYRVTKGRIVISFDLSEQNAYLISPEENEWSYTWGSKYLGNGQYEDMNNRLYISGLGENSRFVGKMATSSDSKATYDYNNTLTGNIQFEQSGTGVYVLSWQTISFAHSWNGKTINYTATEEMPFLIWNPILDIENENDCYDVVVDGRVQIIYNQFEPTFFIGLNTENYDTIKDPNYITVPDGKKYKDVSSEGGSESQREYLYWEYEVDGSEYRFSAEDLKVLAKNVPGYAKLYHSDNGATLSEDEVKFVSLGDHVFSVTFTARHYDDIQYNIWINAVRSHVKFADLSKVYDRTPVDIDTKIIKMGTDQRPLMSITYMDQYGTVLSEPPSTVGKYKAHIVVPEGEFFHPFDEVIDYEIYARVVTIDVTGSMTFTNQPYQIDTLTLDNLTTAVQGPDKGLLDGDRMQGILQTTSFIPKVYDSSLNNTFKWAVPWTVVYIGTYDDVSRNYKVELAGAFEIKPLQFKYNVRDERGNYITDLDEEGHLIQTLFYDSTFHSISINLTYPVPGNYAPAPTSDVVIRYSDISLAANSGSWLTSPSPVTTPGEHRIYFMLKADYFETIIDYVTIHIKELEIIYDDPAWNDGDGFDERYTIEYSGGNQTYMISVIKPSFSATVYYSVDGGPETEEAPMFKEVGEYTVKYRITAPNYEEVINTVVVHVVQPGEEIPSDCYEFEYFNGVYDGNSHSVTANFKTGFINSQPSGFWYKVLFSIDEGKNWTEVAPSYTEVGKYRVDIKYQARGYRDVVIAGQIIIKGKPLYLSTTEYRGVFDGKYHNAGLTTNHAGCSVTYDEDTDKYTYTDASGSVELNLLYSLNANVAATDAEEGWISGPGFKDVGLYTVYVKVEADNYEPTIFETYTPVVIEFLENPSASMDSPQTFEYSKAPLEVEQIEIDTVADGVRTAYWYSAHYGLDGQPVQDMPEERITAPQELGIYYVKIHISPTKNTGSADVEGFVEIVPRKLTVKWDSPQYYDGNIKTPNATVETGTTDEISLMFEVIGAIPPIEVGSYDFNVWMAYPNPNYVLDRDQFTLEIIKRNILFNLHEDFVVKDDFSKWVYTDSPSYDKSDQCPGDDHWHLLGDLHGTAEKYVDDELVEITYSGLSPNHLFYIEMETSSGQRGQYHYSTITNDFYINSVRVIKWDIYEKDENNRIRELYGQPVSVKEFYDVDFDILISLTYPQIDLSTLDIITDYVYDGLAHTIYINVPTKYGSAFVYYKDETTGRYTTTPPRRTLVGEYPIEYYVGATGYEDTYGKATLKITPADLYITVGDLYKVSDSTKTLHEKYDATKHINSYGVTNILTAVPPVPTHIRYYDAKVYKEQDILQLYRNFDINSPIYAKGVDNLLDAGKYYCVVYYEEDDNRWHESFAMKYVELKPRDILVEFAPGTVPDITITYNGKPVIIPLTNATIDTTPAAPGDTDGLLPIHSITTTADRMKEYYVQTNSANAGVYPLATGFEFLAIDIYEIAGHKSVKASNYHPVLVGDFHVEILKKYLEDDEFYLLLDEYTKTYDGKVHTPDYFPKDTYVCASDGEMNMTFYQIDNEGTQTYVPGDQKNAGTYLVILGIDEGTNYYSSYASNAQLKGDGTPYLSYPSVQYTARVSKKVVDVHWEGLEQTFNGEILYPRPTFIDAETEPGTEVEVDLMTLYYDTDVFDFIPKNVINAGDFMVAAKFDTSTMAGKEYEKNYTLSRETVSTMFIVHKLVLALQLGDGGNSNKITHYSSQAPWQSIVYTTPTAGAAEFIAEGDVDIQTWIDNMKISSLADDNAPARVSTISYAETTYVDPEDFVYDIRIRNKAGLDVTDSIDYKILGSVTIVADEIVYDLKDHITVMYREVKGTSTVVGYNLNELNCLTVYNPARYNIANYRIDGEIHSENDRISQAGDYVLTFDITAENRITRSCTVYVTIQKRTAYMIFKEELTKTYDGVPVDVAKLINSNLSGFNGTMSDLQFQYVEIIDSLNEVPLNEAPKAAGNYRVDIISKADNNPTTAQNYTVLEVSQTFSIYPREININYEKDLELLNDEPLGKPWRDAFEALSGDITDIVSGDKLFYEFNLASLARGEFVARRTFKESKNQTQQVFTSDNAVEFTFAWAVKQTDDKGNVLYEEFESPAGSGNMVQQAIDISKNYTVNLAFRLLVHYPYIPANVIGETVTYDGNPHHGTITFEDDKAGRYSKDWYTNNVLQTYSTDLNTLATSTIHNINDLSFTEPGSYTVYYKLTIDPSLTVVKYEDMEGSFNIVINKLERNLTITQQDKEYDGEPAGMKLSGTTTERWFPEHTLTLPMTSVPDNYDLDDVILTYSLGGKESVDPTTGCIEAGVYEFTLIFPETAYYKQTKLSSRFQIRKIKIYIEDDSLLGGARFSYDNLVKTYDFTFNKANANQSDHSNYVLYTMKDGVMTELQDQNLLFSASLITNGKEVGSYHGNDGSLTVFAYEYNVYSTELDKDMTNNYMLDIANASIAIDNIDMVWSTTPAEYVYDGQLHGFNISFAAPSKNQVTIKYKNEATGDYQLTPVQYRDCGEYEVDVELSAKNYNTVYGKLKLTIKRAATEIIYVTNLGKIYDGAEVTLPDRVFTNRDLADEENLRNTYTYEYFYYNEAGDLVANPMYKQEYSNGTVISSGNRPIDVGKYKIKITIPAVKNFDTVTWETDFRISQRDATLNWKGAEFTYDGTPKSPEAHMVLTADDVKNGVGIVLNITITPNGAPNDAEHKSVGFYTATASIDYDQSSDKAMNYKIDKASETFPFRINYRRIAVAFSRKDVLDTDPLHQYNIRYKNSTSYNPDTKYSFDVQNLVSTHEMKDYLQLKYAGTKTYFNITDFQWMDFQTNNPITGNPKIYDENNNEVQNNNLIETYQVLFGLTT
ncbi:MAG: leucine-rich repeat domain-containing protein, partial [Anaeroplasmataceae bacterium]|nr:leucine-rich repeat domain-containing protein [Anaeroplasmataceae bacterium]